MWHVATMPVVDECHDLVVNAILWTTLAFVAVGLRLFTRGFIVKRTGWDDYLMAAAMVSYPSTILLHDSNPPSAVPSRVCDQAFKTWPELLVLTCLKPPWLPLHLARQFSLQGPRDWRLTV